MLRLCLREGRMPLPRQDEESQSGSSADAAMLIALVQTLWAGYKDRNPKVLEHLAEEFTEISPGVSMTRAEFAQSMELVTLASIMPSAFQIIRADANTLIVTYRLDFEGTYQNESLQGPMRAATTLTRRNDRWRILFHAETPW